MTLENATFSPIPAATDGRPEPSLYLRFTRDELELLRSAIAERYETARHEIDEVHHVGGSAVAMELCRKRSALKALLDRMIMTPQPQAVERVGPRRDTGRYAEAGRAA